MRLRWGLAALAFAATFAVGFLVARELAPERLRRQAEERLAEALGGPVTIGRLQLAPGLGLRMVAETVTAWPSEAGPRLSVERVEAKLRPIAFLTGGPILGSLRLDGAVLTLERSRAGAWSPALLERLAETPRVAAASPAAEPWLAPIAALDAAAREILAGPDFTDGIELHGASIQFDDAGAPGRRRVRLALEAVEARLRRHRILGGADLFVSGRLLEAGAERGSLELLGSRKRGGHIEIALATTALDLGTLAPYLQTQDPPLPISGTLSGYIGSKSDAPGESGIEVDLVVAGLRSVIPAIEGRAPRPFEVGRIDLAGFVDVTPEQLRLRELRFENGRLRLETSGRIARPVSRSSAAELSLALRDLEIAELRDLLSWLPEIRRKQVESGLERVEAGRLARFQLGGAAPLAGWEEFLAGQSRELPDRFSLEADLADSRLRVGDSDYLTGLSGHLAWTGDRLEVKGARAMLKDSPLPVLDLTLEGVANLLAGDPARRRLAPGGQPLRGLGALADVLAGDPAKPPQPIDTRIRLEIDALDHPALLWPIEKLSALISLALPEVHVEELNGIWAGVPIRGEAQLTEHPERAVRVQLVCSAPTSEPRAARDRAGWAQGRFEVERLVTRVWSHEHGSARFTANDAHFDFDHVEATLAPSGRVEGTGRLDFAHTGSVPYRASFRITDGDVPALATQLELPADFATGRIELAGSFEGILAPGAHGSKDVSGLLSARAHDGEIRRVLPAVTALALASRSFNPFTGREQIRYDRAEAILEFGAGDMSTTAFSIDGPDLRVFASGSLSLASPTHEIDAHVVLFLFRQIDNLIGKIPVLSLLLLGTNENLLAAYYDLSGPWADPNAKLVPLRSLATGPATLVFEGLPFLVRKSLQAIGAIDGDLGAAPARPFSPEPPPPPKDS